MADRSYDVVIGDGLLAEAGKLIAPVLASPRVIIIADDAVWALHGTAFEESLKIAGISTQILKVAAGEGSKSFASLQHVLHALLALRIDRATTIIAFGGGVVGDLAGFAASIVLRGVPYIQVPTSLLAQVDSSVGGKTAINAEHGKNLIGSFYQPQLVLADSAVLATLPARHMRAGYAEIIKYGLIADADFYAWCLENGAKVIARQAHVVAHAIAVSCAKKAEIVGKDERESSLRAILNFGHTFGHALEAELDYSDALLHGEAVALGMLMACRLSEKLGLLAADVGQQLRAHFQTIGLPVCLRDIRSEWNVEALLTHMQGDKKTSHGQLNFVVLDGLCRARIEKNVPPAFVLSVLSENLVV